MKPVIQEICRCRICGGADLRPVIDLGAQSLTGWFPRRRSEDIPVAPLQLVKCDDSLSGNCGLVQLRHSVDPELIYGERYGYRSGLNASMRAHLNRTVEALRRRVHWEAGDIVLDIGSNDGTLLGKYEAGRFRLVGVDPTAAKFRSFYRDDIEVVPEFFTAERMRQILSGRPAKVITAVSMFYDLEDPLEFMRQVRGLLHREGVWLIEQSYMPQMIARTAYDTICHEHLEYYGLKQIKWMADRAGLKIIDVYFNDVNGGSFAVIFGRDDGPYPEATRSIGRVLRAEAGLETAKPFEDFTRTVGRHRRELTAALRDIRREGAAVFGYGASTKGNVLLQYCGLDENDIPAILDINPDKFGCYTPGTGIPILSEELLDDLRPDFLLVLPWHFRDMIVRKERAFVNGGGVLMFPLPRVDVVRCEQAVRSLV